jgi:hypothetical protein
MTEENKHEKEKNNGFPEPYLKSISSMQAV